MEQAFADLRGLMALAGDMVQLAERFREALAEQARLAGGTPEDHMDASMEADLISMGIASPVTKATSGALYHKELSRQVTTCSYCQWDYEDVSVYHANDVAMGNPAVKIAHSAAVTVIIVWCPFGYPAPAIQARETGKVAGMRMRRLRHAPWRSLWTS